jgi:pyruvate dehydrogenase E2 component (dihydrolipoamide acetyltransferase)
VAVLGVGAIRRLPTVIDGGLVEQPVIHLSLTFDHAAVDGAPAARFLADVVERITRHPDAPKESQ